MTLCITILVRFYHLVIFNYNPKEIVKMKKIFLSFTIISLSVIGFSQDDQDSLSASVSNGKIKKAQKNYDKFSYDRAISNYNLANDNSIESQRNLANSYWRTGENEMAEELYKSLVFESGVTAIDIHNYASILQENKKYKEAEVWMGKFNALSMDDSRGISYLENAGSYEKLQVNTGQFKLKNLDINSEQEDFSPVYYKDKVLFASSREGVKPIRRKWNRNKLPFLDVYQANAPRGKELDSVVQFQKKLNKKFHEGPVCFNADETKMIFTRNNYDGKSEDGLVKLQLYISEFIEDKWQNPIPFEYNSIEYSIGHAAFSPDGEWLYFASDMPGGVGGVDLYKSKIGSDGSYGQPINLGKKINTEGNEMFPSAHETGVLFFSSNGLVGLGGLDVFVAELKEDEEIGKVMNLGSPVNTNRDDFSFILAKSSMNGYLASNREGGKGDDDIYYFDMIKPITFGKTIKGITKDKQGNLIADASIDLFDESGEKVQSVMSDENGIFEFTVDADQKFSINGNKEKHFEGKTEVDSHVEADEIPTELMLEKDPGISLVAKIIDKKTGESMDSVKVTFTDNMTGISEEIQVSETGEFRKPLMGKKLNDRGSYNFTLERDGYLSKTVTYNTEFDKEGLYNLDSLIDLSLDKIELGEDLSKIIDISPIYFDLGRAKIRADAAAELDKIVKVMNENPTMEIELGSHTDSRGSEKSNALLSDKRAKASAAYVRERITNPDRINGKGFGEVKPNTMDLSSEGGDALHILTESYINSFKRKNKAMFDLLHQKNRRTEFLIIKM